MYVRSLVMYVRERSKSFVRGCVCTSMYLNECALQDDICMYCMIQHVKIIIITIILMFIIIWNDVVYYKYNMVYGIGFHLRYDVHDIMLCLFLYDTYMYDMIWCVWYDLMCMTWFDIYMYDMI